MSLQALANPKHQSQIPPRGFERRIEPACEKGNGP